MVQLEYRSLIMQYIFGVALAAYTYLFYFTLPKVVRYDAALNAIFMGFILFVLVSAYFFNGDFKAYIKEQKSALFILLIWFMIAFVGYGLKGVFFDNPTYYPFMARNFYYLTLMILFVAFVDRNAIDRMMTSVYAVYFIYGLSLIPHLLEAEKLGVLPEINKNVVGFFLVPFLAYILLKLQHHKWWMSAWFILGAVILHLTAARTSFLAFILLLFFIVAMRVLKNRLRLFYVMYISTSLILISVLAFFIYPDHQEVNAFFTQRILLWKEYLGYMFNSETILIGTGYTILPEVLSSAGLRTTLHPHNQFITLLVFNGVIGLVFFILLILLSVSRKVKELLPSDGVIFSIVTIMFAEAIIPFFDFFFLSFVFVVNLLINRFLHKRLEYGDSH